MKSAWFSIRAFVVVIAMVLFGGVLSWLALHGNDTAIGALVAFLSTVSTYYLASATGAGGTPHGPTT